MKTRIQHLLSLRLFCLGCLTAEVGFGASPEIPEEGVCHEKKINGYVSEYLGISNFIWHAVTAGQSNFDYKSPTFVALDSMLDRLKILVLDGFDKGDFKLAVSIPELFEKELKTRGNSCNVAYTWAEPSAHLQGQVKPLKEFLKKTIKKHFSRYLESNHWFKIESLLDALGDDDIEMKESLKRDFNEHSESFLKHCAKKINILSVMEPSLARSERLVVEKALEGFPEGHAMGRELREFFEKAQADYELPSASEIQRLKALREGDPRLD